jgi:hypothetical protein
LNEGTRPPGGDPAAPQQQAERELGINEHVHTLWSYLRSFLRARLVPTRIEYALGYDVLSERKLGRVLRYPGGRLFATLWTLNLESYAGVSLYARKLA